MRDSPSLSIIPPLLDKGAVIKAHDPQGISEAKKDYLLVLIIKILCLKQSMEQMHWSL